MNKPNRFSIVAFSALILLFVSCKKDDEKPTNSLTYQGKTYQIKYVGVSELYPYDLVSQSEDNFSHYGCFLAFSDGDFTVTGDEDFKASYLLTAMVFFPYASADQKFTGGSFSFSDILDLFEPNETTQDKYLFTLTGMIMDSNSDGIIDYDEEETVRYVEDGSLDISGSGTHFTFRFNLTDDTGQTLRGDYSGEVLPEEVWE